MIHINLNMIFYTCVEYSPTKNNVHKVLYRKTNKHTHTYTLTHTHTLTHTLIQTAMNSNVYDPDLYHTCACILIQVKREKKDKLNKAMRAKTQMIHIQNRKNTLQPSLLFFRVPCDLMVKFIGISTNKCDSH